MAWNEEIKKELGYCGEQVFIGYNTIFTCPEKVFLSDRVRIDPFCLITTQLKVSSNSHICAHAMLGGGSDQIIFLEGWNVIGYGSKLFTASEDYSGEYGPIAEFWGNNKVNRGNIILEEYAALASDVMVFPSVRLPIGCTIGAKSFVHTNQQLNPWSIYYGNPLKLIKVRHFNKVKEFAKDPNFLKSH